MTESERNDAITTECNTHFNSNIIANIRARLENDTDLTSEEIDTVMAEVNSNIPLITLEDLDVSPELVEVTTSIATKYVDNEALKAKSVKTEAEKEIHRGYNPQDAKESFIVLEECKPKTRVETIDIPDIDYNPHKKQHFLKVWIDNAINIIMFNYKTKQLDMAHYSKTSIKIDKDGNTTQYISGNFKLVVEKDFSICVKGSMGTWVMGDSFLDVEKNQNIDIGMSQIRKVGQNRTLEVGQNRTTTVGTNNTLQIGASDDLTVGASKTVKVGGVHSQTDAFYCVGSPTVVSKPFIGSPCVTPAVCAGGSASC